MLAFKTSWHFSHSHTQLYNKQHGKMVQMRCSNLFIFLTTKATYLNISSYKLMASLPHQLKCALFHGHHNGIRWVLKVTKALEQRSDDAAWHNEFVFHLISLISSLCSSGRRGYLSGCQDTKGAAPPFSLSALVSPKQAQNNKVFLQFALGGKKGWHLFTMKGCIIHFSDH